MQRMTDGCHNNYTFESTYGYMGNLFMHSSASGQNSSLILFINMKFELLFLKTCSLNMLQVVYDPNFIKITFFVNENLFFGETRIRFQNILKNLLMCPYRPCWQAYVCSEFGEYQLISFFLVAVYRRGRTFCNTDFFEFKV